MVHADDAAIPAHRLANAEAEKQALANQLRVALGHVDALLIEPTQEARRAAERWRDRVQQLI